MHVLGIALGVMECPAPIAYQGSLGNHKNVYAIKRSSHVSISPCVMKSKSTQEGPFLNPEILGDNLKIFQKDSKHPSIKNPEIPSLENVLEQTGQCGLLPSMEDIMFLSHECQGKKTRKRTLRIHLLMANYGLEAEHILGSYLVSLFVDCGGLLFALQLFQRLAHRTEHSWTSLVQGYIKAGEWQHAFDTFKDMQEDGVQPSRFTYMALLTCRATLAHVSRGHAFHSKIIKEGLEKDAYIGNALVDMYGRCGLLADAREIFDKVPCRDVVSWNSLILGYAEQRLVKEALLSLEQMQLEGISPNDVTFVCALKACSRLGALDKGQILHSQIVEKGWEREPSIVKSLVDMYSLCRLFADARVIFDLLPVKDHHSWTTLMAAYAEHGFCNEVLKCKELMYLEGLSSNTTAFVHSLKACASLKSLSCGQELHSEVVKLGFQGCPIVASGLITMYIKCESLEEAWMVFDGLLVRDAIVWTTMITGFVEHGFAEEALSSLRQMQINGVFPDAVTFVSALKACCSIAAIDRGREIHVEIVKEGLQTSSFVGSTLIHMYSECGSLTDALDVFEEIPFQDLVLWNTLIDACINCGAYEEALHRMEELRQIGMPLEASTFIHGLKACSCMRELDKGKELHSLVVKQGLERDIFLSSTILDLYCKCGSLSEARKVSDGLVVRNVVSWSVLISGYLENDDGTEALKCLEQMELEHVCPDTVTVVCNLKACCSIGAIDKGQGVHSYIVKVGYFMDNLLGSALVDFYLKFGLLAEGQEVFKCLQQRDVISWSALISGFIDLGLHEKAIDCYSQMQIEGVSPNAVTYFCVLKACGSMGAADTGQEIHMEIVQEALESDLHVSNTLIDMYAKCALLKEAFELFYELCSIRDVVSWSAIITGCVDQGEINKALELYTQMKDQGVVPNNVIVSSILRACGDTTSLETGKRLHAQSFHACEVEPMLATAVLDMYGKCGSIFDAQQLFDSMPVKDIIAVNALFNGYARCGQGDLLLHYFMKIKTRPMDPDDTTYLSLLTMCSHQGLIGEGQEFFNDMFKKGGILPGGKHYDCIIDLLGRAGQLQEAAAMLENMPFQPDPFAWINILGACRRFGNLDLGSQAFDYADKLDNLGPAAFVLMSDMFAVSELADWCSGD